jgi:hypothetical protein
MTPTKQLPERLLLAGAVRSAAVSPEERYAACLVLQRLRREDRGLARFFTAEPLPADIGAVVRFVVEFEKDLGL